MWGAWINWEVDPGFVGLLVAGRASSAELATSETTATLSTLVSTSEIAASETAAVLAGSITTSEIAE